MPKESRLQGPRVVCCQSGSSNQLLDRKRLGVDLGLDQQHCWADLEGEGPDEILWVTGLDYWAREGEAQGW